MIRLPAAQGHIRESGPPYLFLPIENKNMYMKTVSCASRIRTLAWNPTGHLIATGTGDRTLRIWNPDKASVKNSTELRGHTGAVERVAWNPTKESELASCSSDGTVRLWDVRTKNCTAEIKIGGEGFTLAWSPDGNTLIAGRKVGANFQRCKDKTEEADRTMCSFR